MVRGRRNPLHFGLPARLKKTRQAARLTRQRLSLLAGLSNSGVWMIEHGARTPAIDTVEHLARALGCAPGWLAYGPLGVHAFGSGRFPAALQGDDAPDAPDAAVDATAPLRSAAAGERLAQGRQAQGLSRLALGQRAGLSHTAVANLEAGRSLPTIASAEQLATSLDLPPRWLAYGEGEAPAALRATDPGADDGA